MVYAGFWHRNLAIFIDCILLVAIFGVIDLAMKQDFFVSNLLYQIFCASYYIYFTACQKQASVGQMLLKLKVCDVDGHRLSYTHSFARYLAWGIPLWPLIFCTLLPSYAEMLEKVSDQEWAETYPEAYLEFIATQSVQSFFTFNTVLIGIMIVGGLCWALPIAFSKEKTGIHDLICKQRVIKEG